jgi:NAD(P)-dependent dehydrogenase (short-subunit alcohol dehydrogenase family)
MQVKDYHITRTFDISVKGFLIACQEAVKLMEGRPGKIVAVSGYDTLRYLPNHGTLAAAKSAMETLVVYLACELAHKGINVNGVNPGAIDTDSARIFVASTGTDWEAFAARWASYTPMQRLAQPEDIAKVIAFLCTPEAGWITGQTIVADGGLTLSGGFGISV